MASGSGWGHPLGRGGNPLAIAVDQDSDTVYTANIVNGEHRGTVSVINGATCDGTDHAGCGHTPPKVVCP